MYICIFSIPQICRMGNNEMKVILIPAVSQSCNLTILLLNLRTLIWKSTPIVHLYLAVKVFLQYRFNKEDFPVEGFQIITILNRNSMCVEYLEFIIYSFPFFNYLFKRKLIFIYKLFVKFQFFTFLKTTK